MTARTILPGIGHNSSIAVGTGFRKYAWKRARKELISARVPLEIVRIRVRRAQELGLAYPQYASILLGSGRDITGFLFTVGGLQLRLRRQLEIPDHVRAKFGALQRVDRLVLSPHGEAADAFREELEAVTATTISAAAPEPDSTASWGAARDAVLALLKPLKLPRDAVVMVGADGHDDDWAGAAHLAGFIASQDFFRPQTP
ncbi:MAG: hypothetical protein AAF367_05115 [Pseudomonadota bacterium]